MIYFYLYVRVYVCVGICHTYVNNEWQRREEDVESCETRVVSSLTWVLGSELRYLQAASTPNH